MAPMSQADGRTGAACEAEARWAPRGRRSRYGRRRLVGHVDPGTGEVVPNRPTRASAPSPTSRRESCGACAAGDVGPGAVAGPPRSLRGLRPAVAPPRARRPPTPRPTAPRSPLLAPRGCWPRSARRGATPPATPWRGGTGRATGSPATPRRHRRARRRWPRSGGAATRTACRSRRRASRCWWGMAAACRRRRGRPGTPSTRTPGSPGAGGTTTRRPGRAAWGRARVGPRGEAAERELAAPPCACAPELAAGRRARAHGRHRDERSGVVRGRPVGGDGAIAAATARAGYFAPFSNEVMGPLGALAARRDRDAVEKRLGDARGPPGLSTPRASAEGAPAGKPLVVLVALVPAAWLRRRTRGGGLDGDHAPGGPPRRGGGDRAPRTGGPPPTRVRGHREAARHLRQAGLRVADHVITLREFR